MPADFDFSSPQAIAKQINDAFTSGAIRNWPVAATADGGDGKGRVFFGLGITNLLDSGNEQVIVRVPIEVEIFQKQVPTDTPLKTASGAGCGGEGQDRDFGEVELAPTGSQPYKATTGAAFYTLAPKEYEHFVLRFACKQPGTYGALVKVTYAYQAQEKTVVESSMDLVCPTTATNRNAAGGETKLMWDGGRYKSQ